MKYIQITIYTTVDGIEPVTNLLLDLGIEGVIVESPSDIDELMIKKNAYDWDYIDSKVLELKNREPNVTCYLEPTEEGYFLLDKIRIKTMLLKGKELDGAFGWDIHLGRLYVEDQLVDDEDWKDNWKEFFKTVRVTEHLIIKPSWEEYQKEREEDLIIEIDPGMAFGTGTHATTSLCLKLLEKYIKKGDDVLDVGCGSGILSIASALLGAGRTVGIEIDPIAVEIARENVALNHLTEKVDVFEGDLTKGIDFAGDIVVANLMADLVILLTGDVASHLKKDGIYISSGILIEKQPLVVKKLEECGFDVIEIMEEEDWCAIAARLKG